MRRLIPAAVARARSRARYGRNLLLVATVAAAVAHVALADGRDSREAKISVRPEVGKRFTAFELRWRTPVRIGRHDMLEYRLRGPGFVDEPGNRGCHGQVKATWFPGTGEGKRPGQLMRMTVTGAEMPGAEERGWCPGRFSGWVHLWKLKRSQACPPETGRDRCWTRRFIGSFQYTVKERNEAPPPIPVPAEPLLEYVSNGAPTLKPRGVTDWLWVTRPGAALVRLYGVRGDPWRLACLNGRTLAELKQVLRRAARLDQDRVTRPYPRRGRQSLVFGRDGRRLLETLPGPGLSPMKGRLRRKLFRNVDAIRATTRRSDRTRPCRIS